MSQEQKPTNRERDSKHTIDSNEILSLWGGLLTVELKVNFSFAGLWKRRER